jgi:hypothetical protein
MARVIAGFGWPSLFGDDGQTHLVAQHPTRIEVSEAVQRTPYAEALERIFHNYLWSASRFAQLVCFAIVHQDLFIAHRAQSNRLPAQRQYRAAYVI